MLMHMHNISITVQGGALTCLYQLCTVILTPLKFPVILHHKKIMQIALCNTHHTTNLTTLYYEYHTLSII